MRCRERPSRTPRDARAQHDARSTASREGFSEDPLSFLRPAAILPDMTDRQSTILDARAMDRVLRRMADEIVELNEGTDDLIIVGKTWRFNVMKGP